MSVRAARPMQRRCHSTHTVPTQYPPEQPDEQQHCFVPSLRGAPRIEPRRDFVRLQSRFTAVWKHVVLAVIAVINPFGS